MSLSIPGLLMATLGVMTEVQQPARPVTSVLDLDIQRYAGLWHEIAHLPMRYQKQCAHDITARYTLAEDGTVQVRNACITHDGQREVAEGVARPVPGHPGRLQVRFAPAWLAWLPMVWADYWVLDVDPAYQWALVGEPTRRYLWILSRKPTLDRATFDALKARAESMGYDLEPLIVTARVPG